MFVGFVLEHAAVDVPWHELLKPDFPRQLAAYLRRTLPGDEVCIDIYKRSARKSRDQEAGFHAMITPWARDEGHQIDALKRDLLIAVFGMSEKVSPLTKQPIPHQQHTSTLTMAQYSELIERTLEIAAECGYILIAPDEWKRQQEQRRKKQARTKAKEAA